MIVLDQADTLGKFLTNQVDQLEEVLNNKAWFLLSLKWMVL